MQKSEKRFSTLEEAQNYFSKLNLNTVDVQEVVEAKFVAKTILKMLEENAAPAIVTNFWYLFGKMADERLKKEKIRALDIDIEERIKIIHLVPEDVFQKCLKQASEEILGDVSNTELDKLRNSALYSKDARPEVLELIGAELQRRNRVS